ncbi:MAG: heavy metal translocating P-type ATPase [Ardenticatenaceae bacterium]|nr:heavy metal translocating P-type ATPase [Ardenticatenaceae bacterium]
MVNHPEPCALCGLTIDSVPIIETFAGEEKQFCCQGCARVYQVAFDNEMLDEVLAANANTKTPAFTDLILNPGETAYFALGGMWCAGCAVAAEQVLRNQPGIKQVDVSFAAERGRISYDPAQIDPADLLQKLSGLGYRPRLLSNAADKQVEKRQERTWLQTVTAAAFGMQIMVLYLAQLYHLYSAEQYNTPIVRHLQYLVWALATPLLFIGGSSFLRGAWRALRARTATMDTLVALGTLSGYSYSVYITLTGSGEAYFDSVAMITTFVMIGRFLETLGGAQARKDIRKLLSLQPDKAWRRMGDAWRSVKAADLAVGDLILVKPGERVPADGEIVAGEAAVNEALLTGESVPVNKRLGDAIFAGTVVVDTAVTARVMQPPTSARLAQITRLVEQTLSAKPPIQRLADRASAYFALGILGAALLTAVGWLAAGYPLSRALLTAVAVLVVACPCALGLATPLALTVALGRTTQAGILVRNPAALETAAAINRIAFDKTGTLTQGEMAVVAAQVLPETAVSETELLCLAAAVEQYSAHPIAQAIVAACSPSPHPADEFQMLRGLGVSARVSAMDGRRVMVGNGRFLELNGHNPLAEQAVVHTGRGETVVWVGWNDSAAGFIALCDEPNPTAKQALRQLQDGQVQPVMLSGDNPVTTQAIAAELGLAEFEGSCTPADKAARLQGWQLQGAKVGMVGDGVNDAPALAQANLSIAMASGADVAGETADVILMRPDLALIPWLLAFSRQTRRIILENLSWAFAYNLLAVPLAALGVISPVIAAAAMAASSLLVVGNSLRLRQMRVRR